MHKLDNRYERSLKTAKSSTVKRDRVMGLTSTSQPPPNLPSWMIDPNYKIPAPVPTTPSVCMEPNVDPDNPSSEPLHSSLPPCFLSFFPHHTHGFEPLSLSLSLPPSLQLARMSPPTPP